jgi:hypothetical protein
LAALPPAARPKAADQLQKNEYDFEVNQGQSSAFVVPFSASCGRVGPEVV